MMEMGAHEGLLQFPDPLKHFPQPWIISSSLSSPSSSRNIHTFARSYLTCGRRSNGFFLLFIILVLFIHFFPSRCTTNLWVESFKFSFTMLMLGPSKHSHSTIQVKDDYFDTNMIRYIFIIMTHKRFALNE